MADWGEKVTGKYKVKAGDNLTSISSALNIPTDSLQLYNNIENPNKIQVGQELLWRREPSTLENLYRWAFESDKDTRKSRDINNIIQNTIALSAQPKKIESLSFEDFLNDLRISENPDKLGYKNGRWWPFKTANGNIDIGYGIDLAKQTPEYRAKVTKYGLTDEELRKDLLKRFNTYKNDMTKLFNKNRIDISKVPIKYQRGVIDMLHHLGYTGMSEYENFFKGIKNNNLDIIRREAKTTFKDKNGKRKVDIKRYNFRLNNYFNNDEMKQGGRFTFKKNRLVKNAESENKRDMRKKLTKSNSPTYSSNRILNKAKKYQAGGELVNLPNLLGIRDGSWNTGGQASIGAGIRTTFAEDGIKVPEIKVDPSIFASWNSIHSDLVIPDVEYQAPVKLGPLMESLLPYSNKETVKKKNESNNSSKEDASNKESISKLTTVTSPKTEEYTYKGKNQWASDLVESYKRAGVTNPEALKYLLAQDALESGWGKSAQGKYNYGNLTTGSSWKGNYVQGKDKDASGNPISQKFRSYNSMDEYTKDKVNFLTRLYDFNQNDNFQTFINKLTGANKGNRRYAEARNYGEILSNVYNSVSKYQQGGTLIFGNPETSEMLTYRMEDGSIKTVPNTGAGYVSGTDPVGQMVVEGAILNKPLGYISGKIINWARNLLKNKPAVGNFASPGNEVAKNTERIIKKEDLPSYAKPNWQGDAVELTKDRMREGGFNRLNSNKKEEYEIYFDRMSKVTPGKISDVPKSPIIIDYSNKSIQDLILKALPSNPKSSELGKKSTNWGAAYKTGVVSNKKFGVFSDAPEFVRKGQVKSDMDAHEFSHHIFSLENIEPDISFFSKSRFPIDEILARGTQIKNYFGLKEGEELTGDMLRYAAQNMIKDRGYDNNLTEFFSHIIDYDKMAKYIDKYAPITVTAILYNNDNN